MACTMVSPAIAVLFFFNDTATTEIYTLSLHDALPISGHAAPAPGPPEAPCRRAVPGPRSEEHTSELQSHHDIVCRLLLEKKKKESGGYSGKTPRARDRAAVVIIICR